MLSSEVFADLNKTVSVADTNTTSILPAGSIVKSMFSSEVLSDLNRTVTSSEIASNTITTAQLNEQILKYLKPEITQSPALPSARNGQVYNGQSITLSTQSEGTYLCSQWKKNGFDLSGENNATLHDGNYTRVVSSDFGSVHTQSLVLDINEAALYHTVASASNLEMIWVSPGTFTVGIPTTETSRGGDETQHQVTLTQGFYLGKYEVTQSQYQVVMTGTTDSLSATPSQWSNNPNRPVDKKREKLYGSA